MNNRCSVCGCVAQPGELAGYDILGTECEVCSVCRKQLNSIKQNPLEKSGVARELLFRDTKGHRSGETQGLIYNLFSSLGIDTSYEAVVSNATENLIEENKNLENKVDELEGQLEQLKKDFYGFRKRYYLMKILSAVIPVVLIIIMLIVIFASGALDNIFNYYSSIAEMAEM